MSEASDDREDAPEDPALTTAEPETVLSIRRIDRGLGHAEVGLLCLFLSTLIGVAVFNFVANHFLDYNPTWTDELIRYSVFFTAWTGAALAAQTDQLLNMDMIARLVKPRSRLWIRLGTRLATLVACGFLAYGGFKLRDVVAGEPYELIGKGKVVLALPIGAIVVAFHVFLHLIIDVIYLVLRRDPPEGQMILH